MHLHNFLMISHINIKSGDQMFNPRTNRFLVGSAILSSALSVVVVALTIYHHFVIQDKIDDLKNEKIK